MASTYSALKIELIGTGEQSGTWGVTTDVNLGDQALGEAITGSADVAFSSADVTVFLTDTNTSQTARNLRLNLTGTSGGARQLILGSGCQIEKLYLINNGLADAVTVKNTTGTGIAVAAGKSMFVFNNGTNVVDAVTYLSSLTLGAALPVASGGTGSTSTTFVNAATNVTGTLPVANGGTGAATLTANNVILGNGTSAVQVVAPSTSGNVLTSNGTTWTSVAPSSTFVGSRGQAFTSNGTFTIPSGITALKITVVGGGGGSGGTASGGGLSGGGGGGATAVSYLTGLTPSNTLAVTVGGAGSGGIGNNTGNNGGNSIVASGTQTITTITANGGDGGGQGFNSTGGGGAGGTATNGTINCKGGAGSSGTIYTTVGCSAIIGPPGDGGNSTLGGGGNGSVGGAYGGGGGGISGSGTATGLAGAAGVVIFEW